MGVAAMACALMLAQVPNTGAGPRAAMAGVAPRAAPGGVTRSESLATYIASILEHRIQKDSFFRSGRDSPVPAEIKAAWRPLAYYPVDPSWKQRLPFVREANPPTITFLTSTGENRPYWKLGRLTIERDGTRKDLFAYRAVDSKPGDVSLWIPFVDAAAGRETYPAGRYLDAALGADGTVLVDFNLAYNPYCAYGWERYSCPLAPRDNRLPFAVRAGERGFHR